MPATPEAPARPDTILAFDYGRRRIGIAVGQQVTGSASPLGAASNNESGPDWASIDRYVADWQPARLIVGLPRHADGRASELGAEVKRFGRALARYDLGVEFVDERYTSIEATDRLRDARAGGRRGRVTKEAIDAAAAVVIAERWLAAN